MAEDYYKEISIDGITPDLFPEVAVYLKTGATSYMLYKPHGTKMTPDDLDRLQRRASEFIYVRTGDMEEVAAYQENNLSNLLGQKGLKSIVRGKILFQVCADYVGELVESPPKVREIERCRNLTRQIVSFVARERDAMDALKAVTAENPYNIVHSVQVAAFSLLMHTRIFPKITGAPLEDVGIGAFLLDMGMALADDPGKSSGSLSHHEYQMMKLHASMGHDFLNRTGLFSDTSLAIVRHHHERFDGKGYPDHLRGDAIPKGVQIVALCDSFTALTSERGFRKAVTTEQALQTMKGATGAHEPALFQSFEKIVREIKY